MKKILRGKRLYWLISSRIRMNLFRSADFFNIIATEPAHWLQVSLSQSYISLKYICISFTAWFFRLTKWFQNPFHGTERALYMAPVESINRAKYDICKIKCCAALRLWCLCSPLMCAAVEVCKFAANSPTRGRAAATLRACCTQRWSGILFILRWMSNFDFKGMLSMNAAQNDGDFASNITVEAHSPARQDSCVRLFWIFYLTAKKPRGRWLVKKREVKLCVKNTVCTVTAHQKVAKNT